MQLTPEAVHALLEDINACGSDALTALEAGNLAFVRTNVQALLDLTRETLGQIEGS